MAKGITQNEPDPRILYADIIDHPNWRSRTHPHMSLYNRAAQFSPFAALTGYDEMVSEQARYTDRRIELDETGLERLNLKLGIINHALRDGKIPTVSITYFVADSTKTGGRYETSVESIKRIDVARGCIVLNRTNENETRNTEISMQNILEIHGELVDYLDAE